MEKFNKVTEEFIENVINLRKQVVGKVSAKNIIYGTNNQSIKRSSTLAILNGSDNNAYLVTDKFAIQKGCIAKLDDIFEDINKSPEGSLNLNLFYSEEHIIDNLVESKILSTKVYSKNSTSYIDSHFYRFFKDNGVEHFMSGKGNTVLMYDNSNRFIGVIMGIKTPEDFENEITFKEYLEDSELLKEFKEYHQERLIKKIVDENMDTVLKNIVRLNSDYKDYLDGDDLYVYKGPGGYYELGYKLNKPLMYRSDYISVFDYIIYGRYTDEGEYFEGPSQKITKSTSKILATAMHNALALNGLSENIQRYKDKTENAFKQFKEGLILLEDVVNVISDSFKKDPLTEFNFDINNRFYDFNSRPSVDIRMFGNKYHFRIKVIDKKFTLIRYNSYLEKDMIRESIEKSKIVEILSIIAKKEVEEISARKQAIFAIDKYTQNMDLIISLSDGMYFASQHSYKLIERGKLKTFYDYKDSRAAFIYDLYKKNELEFFKFANDFSLTKKNIDKLPKIYIKDILKNSIQKQSSDNTSIIDESYNEIDSKNILGPGNNDTGLNSESEIIEVEQTDLVVNDNNMECGAFPGTTEINVHTASQELDCINLDEIKGHISLLKDIASSIENSIGSILVDFQFSIRNGIKDGYKAYVIIKMFKDDYCYHLEINDGKYILKDYINLLSTVKECASKEEIIEFIITLAEDEIKLRDERNLGVLAIKHYLDIYVGDNILIMPLESSKIVLFEQGFKYLIKGALYNNKKYPRSREDYLYDLYKKMESMFFWSHENTSIKESCLEELPKVFIKDIIESYLQSQSHEDISMKVLLNLQNATENNLLKVLDDTLKQAYSKIAPGLELSCFFNKNYELGKELHNLIEKLATQVFGNIENSTAKEVGILKMYADLIPDFPDEFYQKVYAIVDLKNIMYDSNGNFVTFEEVNKKSTQLNALSTINTPQNIQFKDIDSLKNDMFLLKDATTTIKGTVGDFLVDFKFYIETVPEVGNKLYVDMNLFRGYFSYRLEVQDGNYTLTEVPNHEFIIQNGTKDEVMQFIASISLKELEQKGENNLEILAIKEYMRRYDKNDTHIINLFGEILLFSEQYSQHVSKNGLCEPKCYNDSRNDSLYRLYNLRHIDFFYDFDNSSFEKSHIEQLPKVFIKDIIENYTKIYDKDSPALKILLNLKNCSDANILKVLEDTLIQANLKVTINSVLRDFFTKDCKLGDAIQTLINKSVNKVLNNIELSTDKEVSILKAYADIIPDLNSDVFEKINIAAALTLTDKQSYNSLINSNGIINTIEDEPIVTNSKKVVALDSINSTEINNVDSNTKKYFYDITDSITKINWEIRELLHLNNVIKAVITTKYGNRRVVGLYADNKEDHVKVLIKLLSNYYSVPIKKLLSANTITK